MVALAHPGVENIPTEPMIAVAWPAFRFSEAKGRSALAAIRAALRREHRSKLRKLKASDGRQSASDVYNAS